MDHGQFDAFTRAWSADSSRRQALRALLGGALGGVATKLGPSEDTAAKGKNHQTGHKDRKRSGQVQAAGKKHKKHKNDHKDKNKDKPRQCSPGFRLCSNGACMADKPGICCIDEEFCPGGKCRAKDGCCPGDRQCYGTNTCVGPNECCPAEQKCGDGECYPKDGCCPERKCANGVCAAPNECCEEGPFPFCGDCEDAVCENGSWVCRSQCEAGKVCCGGSCLAACPPGQELDSETCQCKVVCPAGQETCADGTCCDGQCTQHTCCPSTQDFCLGTCCVPGNRCVKNGRHGICCKPEQTEDCYSVYGHFVGCLDPTKCYCDTLAGRVVCNP